VKLVEVASVRFFEIAEDFKELVGRAEVVASVSASIFVQDADEQIP